MIPEVDTQTRPMGIIGGREAASTELNFDTSAPWYRPKQQRAMATVQALLDATIHELETYGETGLRQERILEASGVAQGSLYHHFGSRDGLIDAAYNEIFIREVDAMVSMVKASISESTENDSMANRSRRAIELMTEPERWESRRKRLLVLAAALKRPGLAKLVAAEQHRITNEIAAVVRLLQVSGVVSQSLDPRSVAAFLQAYSFGQLLMSIDPEPPAVDEWRRVVTFALSGLAAPATN